MSALIQRNLSQNYFSLCEKENNFEGPHNCVAPKRIKRVFQGVNVKKGRRKNNV